MIGRPLSHIALQALKSRNPQSLRGDYGSGGSVDCCFALNLCPHALERSNSAVQLSSGHARMLLARVDGMVRADSVTLDGKDDAELSQVESVASGGCRCGRCHWPRQWLKTDRLSNENTEQDYVL